MPSCANCGSFVSQDYARVFTPSEVDAVRCCPSCPDKLRENGKVLDARAARTAPSSMDEGQVDEGTDDEESIEALT